MIWNEKTSIQAEKVSYDWLPWVFSRVLIGSFELLHLLTTGQGNCIVHDLTTTLNYNPSAIRLLCLKATLPWTWEDAVVLDKRFVHMSYFGSSHRPRMLNANAFIKKPKFTCIFAPHSSVDLIIQMETPSEKYSYLKQGLKNAHVICVWFSFPEGNF